MNSSFYVAVRQVRAYAIARFQAEGADLNSEVFLSRFPFGILDEGSKYSSVALREGLISAAFSGEFRARTEEAIGIFCSNQGDRTLHDRLLSMVDDFLDYALPRSVGLPDDDLQFDVLYSRFEKDFFGDTFTLDVIASLENISDHSGKFRPTAGLKFSYTDLFPSGSLNAVYLRERAIPFLELKNTVISGGGELRDKHSFFLLEFQEERAKNKESLTAAYKRAEEITRKVVLSARLVTGAPVYAECIGLRTLNHYSGGGRGMDLWHPRGGWLDEHSYVDLQSCASGFEKLVALVLPAPAASIEVLYVKIDDAFRRRRDSLRYSGADKARAAMDQLLDYCQALESMLPFKGKDQIASCAAMLLPDNVSAPGGTTGENLKVIQDMYDLRNLIMHGQLDEVLEDKVGTQFKLEHIERFRRCIYDLAVLYFLNPDTDGKPNFRRFMKQFRRGQRPSLKTLYGPNGPW